MSRTTNLIARGIPRQIARLSGWRRFASAFVAGGLTVFSLAPFYLWFLPFLTFPVLIWLLDGCRGENFRDRFWSAAFVGWCFGFGYFLIGLYWIGAAFLVEADKFAWLLPIAVLGMPAGLALFYGLATGVSRFFWHAGSTRTVALALGLGMVEWLRGHILTGFPWNAIGYTVASQEALLQVSSLIGIYGLGVFAVLLYSLPAVFFVRGSSERHSQNVGEKLHIGAVIALYVGAMIFGSIRVPEASHATHGDTKLRIVQPNISQTDKWRPEKKDWIFSRYLDLSQRNAALETDKLNGVTHLIWPESALPFLLARSDDAKRLLAEILPDGVVLLTGALRMENALKSDGEGAVRKFYNSLFVMDHDATLLGTYDKMHLVPFGEFLPFQETLETLGFEQLTRLRGGFSNGSGSRILRVRGVPVVGPLICYEVIFSGYVAEDEPRPGWLLNVTNDAWFGRSLGPYQHLQQARVRAVEEGLPIVRAANTGVSAVIDPYGRILAKVPLNTVGIIDLELPKPLRQTIYARFSGEIFFGIILFAFFYAMFLVFLNRYPSLSGGHPSSM